MYNIIIYIYAVYIYIYPLLYTSISVIVIILIYMSVNRFALVVIHVYTRVFRMRLFPHMHASSQIGCDHMPSEGLHICIQILRNRLNAVMYT